MDISKIFEAFENPDFSDEAAILRQVGAKPMVKLAYLIASLMLDQLADQYARAGSDEGEKFLRSQAAEFMDMRLDLDQPSENEDEEGTTD